MDIRTRTAASVATLGAAALAAGALVGAGTAGASAPAPAAAPAPVPVVTVHVNSHAIRLSVGTTMRAGRVIFEVVTRDGSHILQLARLHHGYTLQEASADFGKAFSGDVVAVNRVDDNITFRGGAPTRPDKPGRFAVVLTAGRYLVADQSSNTHTWLHVRGTAPARATIPTTSHITAFSYGFGTSPATLPKSGWTHINNRSDQPHFIIFNRVKAGTTRRMVARALHTSHGIPSFFLKAGTQVGVISPYRGEEFHYRLPAGRYFMGCFWPDDTTGMPHAFMGMFKLVNLA